MQRDWMEVNTSPLDKDLPDMGEEAVAIYSQQLDRVVDEVIVRAPDLAEVATDVQWCVTHSPSDTAMAMAGQIDDQIAVVVQQATVDKYDFETLVFIVGHELSHVRLGHVRPGNLGWTNPDDVRERVWHRVTEVLTNDHLVEAGISMQHRPGTFTICGDEAFGFSVAGRSRRELWDCLTGMSTFDELCHRPRDVEMAVEDGWKPVSMSPEAETFWADKRGVWQPEWSRAHDRLCMDVRRLRRDALVATI